MAPSQTAVQTAPDLTGEALAEAMALSQREGAALVHDEYDDDEEEVHEGDEFSPEAPPYNDDDDDDLAALNDPEIDTLGEAPLLGTAPGRSEMYGQGAQTLGRASSPKLFAQAAQFPTAVQFRVWRWENGVPVGIGAIDAQASEDDFVRKFYGAMPQEGDGRFQFRLRPIDIRGQEMNKEFTTTISEHHSELLRIRERKAREAAERGSGSDPVIIGQGDGAGAHYAEEMGRMFEHAVEAAERRTELLQSTLEDERARLREEEKARLKERIQVANQGAEVVQKMTERLMDSDRARSKEQLEAQGQQSGLLLQTLTTVFSQQQEAARGQAERARQVDEARMQQDREFYERQRQETEGRRVTDREEAERKRRQEQDEHERRMSREREEAERRAQSDRDCLSSEERRREEQARVTLEQMKMEAERREREAERRRDVEKEEARLRYEREKLEMERQKETMREDRERQREELEARRRADREEFERKMVLMREESERRERQERERLERERQDFQLRMERERAEREAAAQRRADEMRRDEEGRRALAERDERRRREELEMRLKQMDIDSQRGREHQERMTEQARLDREAQREASERRERVEREAREAAERDRQRQHEMMMREMEMAQQRDREHQERMLQLQQTSGGAGGGSLFGTIGEQLGMEAPELLERIFGAKDGEGGWGDAIPKVLGAVAEIGKAAITANAEKQKKVQVHGRRQVAPGAPQAQIIHMPSGPQVVVPTHMPAMPGMPFPLPPQEQRAEDLPDGEFDEFDDDEFDDEEVVGEEAEMEGEDEVQVPAEPVNTLARAKTAGLSLFQQKGARKALKAATGALSKAPEDEWLGILTEAVSAEVNIYYYIRAVTVDAALAEATDDAELRERVVAAMKESGLIPEDVPYNEDDFARLQTEGGEQ